MRPSQIEPYGSQRTDRLSNRPQDLISPLQSQSQSQSSTRRLRSEESWIEIASQPSSSSLVSLNREEIITTGLQIRREDERRPRELHLNDLPRPSLEPRSMSAAGSSQDEYEESGSDSDRFMSSSNEDIQNESPDEGEDEDEDETSTALGIGSADRNVFTPQPNAFSHPPSGRSASTSEGNTYFQPVSQHPHELSDRLPSNRLPNIQRPVARERTSTSNIQPDHDAALRASLTTLLSCAAAVRKDKEPEQITRRQSTQPTTLRLVPGSELNGGRPSPVQKQAQKRRSRESSKERHAKKLRSAKPQPGDELVSPTMMTWFVSAGMVLILSAISFGAGYAWGKEVGRIEGQMSIDGSACGREALRGSRTGLSKLRLTSVRA